MEERARCEPCEDFRDLWEKGYYMGGGSKFGGDLYVLLAACLRSELVMRPVTENRRCA